MSFTICTCSVGEHTKAELVDNATIGCINEVMKAGLSYLNVIHATAGLGKVYRETKSQDLHIYTLYTSCDPLVASDM